MRFLVFLCLICAVGSRGFAGEYYRQFVSSAGTNEDCACLDDYPFLVDTNNTGTKLASGPLNLQSLKERGELSGIRLGMTMDEVVGRWGKPYGGYAPKGCLHDLPTFFYGDVSLAFEGPLLETIYIKLNRTLSITSSVVRALGTPTSSSEGTGKRRYLSYISSKLGIELVFYKDLLSGVWLERTPSRALRQEANPQSEANKGQPFSTETNRVPAAAASGRSP